jgi:hypothetical protein
MRRIRSGCCARTTSGHALAATTLPKSVINSRLRMSCADYPRCGAVFRDGRRQVRDGAQRPRCLPRSDQSIEPRAVMTSTVQPQEHSTTGAIRAARFLGAVHTPGSRRDNRDTRDYVCRPFLAIRTNRRRRGFWPATPASWTGRKGHVCLAKQACTTSRPRSWVQALRHGTLAGCHRFTDRQGSRPGQGSPRSRELIEFLELLERPTTHSAIQLILHDRSARLGSSRENADCGQQGHAPWPTAEGTESGA